MLRAARALGVMPAAHIGPVGEGQFKDRPLLTYIKIWTRAPILCLPRTHPPSFWN